MPKEEERHHYGEMQTTRPRGLFLKATLLKNSLQEEVAPWRQMHRVQVRHGPVWSERASRKATAWEDASYFISIFLTIATT